jgi:hypothetical protein
MLYTQQNKRYIQTGREQRQVGSEARTEGFYEMLNRKEEDAE